MSVASIRGDEWEDTIALWDTGSQHSGIAKTLALKLGLKQKGTRPVRYGNGVVQEEPVYLVRVKFSESELIATLEVDGFDDKTQGFIVGMDIIHCGRFLLEPDGSGGVVFTFSI